MLAEIELLQVYTLLSTVESIIGPISLMGCSHIGNPLMGPCALIYLSCFGFFCHLQDHYMDHGVKEQFSKGTCNLSTLPFSLPHFFLVFAGPVRSGFLAWIGQTSNRNQLLVALRLQQTGLDWKKPPKTSPNQLQPVFQHFGHNE